MKVREVIRLIEQDGWRFHSQKGSHRQYAHPTKTGSNGRGQAQSRPEPENARRHFAASES
jgi:hypothetical protein